MNVVQYDINFFFNTKNCEFRIQELIDAKSAKAKILNSINIYRGCALMNTKSSECLWLTGTAFLDFLFFKCYFS